MDRTRAEFANEAFYLAFESKDYPAMEHLWSTSREVVCIHPGWPALIGREAVLQSWRSILGNPEQGTVSFYGAQTHEFGTGLYAVVCYEQAGAATLVATNIFVEEDQRLRLILHQAGYCGHPPPPPT